MVAWNDQDKADLYRLCRETVARVFSEDIHEMQAITEDIASAAYQRGLLRLTGARYYDQSGKRRRYTVPPRPRDPDERLAFLAVFASRMTTRAAKVHGAAELALTHIPASPTREKIPDWVYFCRLKIVKLRGFIRTCVNDLSKGHNFWWIYLNHTKRGTDIPSHTQYEIYQIKKKLTTYFRPVNIERTRHLHREALKNFLAAKS